MAAVGLLLIMLLFLGNEWITVTQHTIESDEIDQELRILHVSDLHNKQFGSNQIRLLRKAGKCDPDVILVTGDSVDERRFQVQPTLECIAGLIDIAPVVFVTGNHEWGCGKWSALEQQYLGMGVTVLSDASFSLSLKQQEITVIGIDDPDKRFYENPRPMQETVKRALDKAFLDADTSGLSVLLAHRPEFFALYAKTDADVVFSGHAHGGQVRLPWIGGLIAPGQGILPHYDAGRYKEGNTFMFVSRGLGNSIFPLRINNFPELVVVDIVPKAAYSSAEKH